MYTGSWAVALCGFETIVVPHRAADEEASSQDVLKVRGPQHRTFKRSSKQCSVCRRTCSVQSGVQAKGAGILSARRMPHIHSFGCKPRQSVILCCDSQHRTDKIPHRGAADVMIEEVTLSSPSLAVLHLSTYLPTLLFERCAFWRQFVGLSPFAFRLTNCLVLIAVVLQTRTQALSHMTSKRSHDSVGP